MGQPPLMGSAPPPPDAIGHGPLTPSPAPMSTPISTCDAGGPWRGRWRRRESCNPNVAEQLLTTPPGNLARRARSCPKTDQLLKKCSNSRPPTRVRPTISVFWLGVVLPISVKRLPKEPACHQAYLLHSRHGYRRAARFGTENPAPTLAADSLNEAVSEGTSTCAFFRAFGS